MFQYLIKASGSRDANCKHKLMMQKLVDFWGRDIGLWLQWIKIVLFYPEHPVFVWLQSSTSKSVQSYF